MKEINARYGPSDPFLTQNLFKSLQQLSLSILSLYDVYAVRNAGRTLMCGKLRRKLPSTSYSG